MAAEPRHLKIIRRPLYQEERRGQLPVVSKISETTTTVIAARKETVTRPGGLSKFERSSSGAAEEG